MLGLFESYGVVTSPQQARALSEQEIVAMQQTRALDMQQAKPSSAYYLLAQNWRPPEKPLDERFADFKVRLAAALERRKLTNTTA